MLVAQTFWFYLMVVQTWWENGYISQEKSKRISVVFVIFLYSEFMVRRYMYEATWGVPSTSLVHGDGLEGCGEPDCCCSAQNHIIIIVRRLVLPSMYVLRRKVFEEIVSVSKSRQIQVKSGKPLPWRTRILVMDCYNVLFFSDYLSKQYTRRTTRNTIAFRTCNLPSKFQSSSSLAYTSFKIFSKGLALNLIFSSRIYGYNFKSHSSMPNPKEEH